jgi:hypothetical protein
MFNDIIKENAISKDEIRVMKEMSAENEKSRSKIEKMWQEVLDNYDEKDPKMQLKLE